VVFDAAGSMSMEPGEAQLRWRHQPQAQAARKTKEGKKRMQRVGRVEIPREAFPAVLKVGQSDAEE
jgi:hypothetical protein